MAKSLFRLLIQVNHAFVAIFNVANMSFNAVRDNKILAKISEFTVTPAQVFTLGKQCAYIPEYKVYEEFSLVRQQEPLQEN